MPEAPIPTARDESDPLSPDHLRNLKLTADQAVHAHGILTRLARNPAREPGYLKIRADLADALADIDAHLKNLEGILFDKREEKTLALGLDMSFPENIALLGILNGQIRAAEAAIDELARARKDVVECLR